MDVTFPPPVTVLRPVQNRNALSGTSVMPVPMCAETADDDENASLPMCVTESGIEIAVMPEATNALSPMLPRPSGRTTARSPREL